MNKQEKQDRLAREWERQVEDVRQANKRVTTQEVARPIRDDRAMVAAAPSSREVEKAKGAFKSAGLGYALAALAPLVVAIIRGILGV